ncbi:Uncharacterised protein [Streptococcus pneumoniae]|nr:Uncharacterised protein [Streptococcus pneumoniae]
MKLNKEDWLRLLEKAIDNIPETLRGWGESPLHLYFIKWKEEMQWLVQ